MASRQSEIQGFIRDVLTECGATEIEFCHNRRHPRVFFEIGGDEKEFVFSITPSDWRAQMNMRGQLRRMCRATEKEPEPMYEQMNGAAPADPRVIATDQALSLYKVSDDDDEPRMLDTDIGERLGLGRPRDIRAVIERNRAELESHGGLRFEIANPGIQGGRPTTTYYLNEAQALLVCMLSRTRAAAEVRRLVISVFMGWRQGALPQHPAASANLATDAAVAVLIQIRDATINNGEAIADLRSDHGAIMDVVAQLESRVQAVEQREVVVLPVPTEPEQPPEPEFLTLAKWCRVNGIDFGTPGRLGRRVTGYLRGLKAREGLQIEKNRYGRNLYPRHFLDRHADQIRAWLA